MTGILNVLAGVRGAANFGSSTDQMPAMTSNTAPSGTCSASSAFGTDYAAWKAAADDASDNTAEKCWISNSTTTGWWQYQFGSATGIGGYSLRADSAGTWVTRMPKNWTLLASNTGSFSGEQVTLDTQTNQSFTAGQRKTYTFTNSTTYTYFRLNVTANNGDATYLQIGEMELLA
jgi:hypothetical protein